MPTLSAAYSIRNMDSSIIRKSIETYMDYSVRQELKAIYFDGV